MNWDKSKTWIIVFLLGLNVFLGVMLVTHEDAHAVQAEDIAVIQELLAGANIVLEGALLPVRFDPVDQLVLRPAEYDLQRLLSAFFESPGEASRTAEFGNIIFSSPEGTLTITRHIVTFEPGEAWGIQGAGPGIGAFVEANPALFPGFELETEYANAIVFRQVYGGHIVMPNHLTFFMEDGNIREVRYTLYPVEGFVGVPKAIIPPQSALFMLGLGLGMGTMDESFYENIYVLEMDIVQNLQDDQDILTTTPYYRITIAGNEAVPAIMLVNALTGDIE